MFDRKVLYVKNIFYCCLCIECVFTVVGVFYAALMAQVTLEKEVFNLTEFLPR